MLRIRLARVGRKHDPSYRVIVTERGRAPQPGNYVEQLGTYDARSDEYDLKPERIEHWISNGAQPSETVHNLLVKAGIIEDDTVNPLPNKSPVETEDEDSTDTGEESEEEMEESTEENSESEAEEEVDEKNEDENEDESEEKKDEEAGNTDSKEEAS